MTSLAPWQPVRKTHMSAQFHLWIDGVGVYLLSQEEHFRIGGPQPYKMPRESDLPLRSNLSACHAVIHRFGIDYVIDSTNITQVEGCPVNGQSPLFHEQTITLGNSVELKFRQPSKLSCSATLELQSVHQPAQRIDGVVLMDQSCLMGPQSQSHIECVDWAEQVVLFHRDGQFFCKTRGEFTIDDEPAHTQTPVPLGKVVEGADFCFRLTPFD